MGFATDVTRQFMSMIWSHRKCGVAGIWLERLLSPPLGDWGEDRRKVAPRDF